MSNPIVVHKLSLYVSYWDRQAKCGAITRGSLNTTQKWARVTCKNCLRKRPKPTRKLALWPEIIETLEDIVSDVGGGPGRSLPNEIAHDSGLADQAAFARPLLAKMKGAK